VCGKTISSDGGIQSVEQVMRVVANAVLKCDGDSKEKKVLMTESAINRFALEPISYQY